MSTVYFRDKVQDSDSDTGKSVREVSDGEVLQESVLNRPIFNLKNRTDEISRYLEKLRVEKLLDTSRHLAIVEVANDGSIVGPGMLEIVKQGSSYFVIPGHLDDTNNENLYRVIVTSGVENAGCYSISREAFHSFYTDNSPSGYSESNGLSTVTDTISLAVPRYTDLDISEASKDIQAGSSTAKPIMEATYTDDLTLNITNVVSSSTDNALIKTLSLNRVKISLNPNATDYTGFINLVQGTLSDLYVTIEKSDSSPDLVLELDTSFLEVDGDDVYVYLKSFSRADTSFTNIQRLIFTSSDVAGSSFFFYLNSQATVELQTGIATPFDYIIPLFYMAGDRIVVPGVGSVIVDEIDRILSLGSRIMLRGDGRVETNLVSGQVDHVYVQAQAIVQDVGTSFYHDFSIPVYNDLSLENSYYYLESIEILEVVNPTHTVAPYIDLRDSTDNPISVILREMVHNSGSQAQLTHDQLKAGDKINLPRRKPDPGDYLKVTFQNVDTSATIDVASGFVLKLTYSKFLEF